MTLDLTFFLFAIPAVIFAGTSKGGFGSGASFAATPLLALVVDPSLSIGLLLPLLMLMDVSALRPYWRKWNSRDAIRLIIGAIPGVAIATAFYAVADDDLLRILLGVVSIGFVVFQIFRAKGWIPQGSRSAGAVAGLIAGACAGFTSFIAHAGGPPAAIYLLNQRLGKTEYQATTVIVFWAVNIFKAVPYAYAGILTLDLLLVDILLIPFALFGVWIGLKAHYLISERNFFLITYVFLTITGAKLIFDALT